MESVEIWIQELHSVMKEQVLAIVDELQRLRKEGETHAFVSESSLQLLRGMTAGNGNASSPAGENVVREKVIESIPENIRSASAADFDRVLKTESQPAPVRKAPESKLPSPPVVPNLEGDKQARWEALREIVLNCPTCGANVRDGFKVVFGVGNIDTDIFFCGEAPGADEEVKGEPFVGKAGQLLDKMIGAMGLAREKVYIGNIMNWRPQLPTRVGNRPPTAEEMSFCLPYLRAQVEVVQPKLIVALGATAAKGLLGADSFRSLREIRGRWHDFAGIPVLPTYHPSYLLRNDTKRDKRAAWEDLLMVMEKAELPISDKQRGYFL